MNSVGYYTTIKHNVDKNEDVHLFRERKEHTGELVQADGTPFDWFKNEKNYCIQGFVDDANGYPTGLYMTKNECLTGYVEAFRNMAVSEGIPMAIYPDKASIFFVNQHHTVEATNEFLRDEFPKIYKKWFPKKPKFREVYYDVDDIVLSQIKQIKKTNSLVSFYFFNNIFSQKKPSNWGG